MNRDELIARAKAKGMDDKKAAEVADAYLASKGTAPAKSEAKPKKSTPKTEAKVDVFTFEDEFIPAPPPSTTSGKPSARDFVTTAPAAMPPAKGPPPGVAATLSPADARRESNADIAKGEAVGKQALRDALKAKVKDNPAAASLVDKMSDEEVMERMQRF